jgi:glycine/D-amino acid oxidase-like deaminating enzyme
MKRPEIAIVGGGLSGRLLAWRAAHSGHQVALYEASGRLGEGAAAWAAAGMITPSAEPKRTVWPKLTVHHQVESAIIHPVCALHHLGLADQLQHVGEALAKKAVTPIRWRPRIPPSRTDEIRDLRRGARDRRPAIRTAHLQQSNL